MDAHLIQCTRCMLIKPTSDFSKSVGRNDGIASQCKSCGSISSKESADRRMATQSFIDVTSIWDRHSENGRTLITPSLCAEWAKYWGLTNVEISSRRDDGGYAVFEWPEQVAGLLTLPGGKMSTNHARRACMPSTISMLARVSKAESVSGYKAIDFDYVKVGKGERRVLRLLMSDGTEEAWSTANHWISGRDSISPPQMRLKAASFSASSRFFLYIYEFENDGSRLVKIGHGVESRSTGDDIIRRHLIQMESKGYAWLAEALLHEHFMGCCHEPLTPGTFPNRRRGESEVFSVDFLSAVAVAEEIVSSIDQSVAPNEDQLATYQRFLGKTARLLHKPPKA